MVICEEWRGRRDKNANDQTRKREKMEETEDRWKIIKKRIKEDLEEGNKRG